MKFFSSLMLKNFSQPFELKAVLNDFSQMVPIISMNASRYKRVYHSALQAMKHGSREQP